MINYEAIYLRTDEFLQTRQGLANPKTQRDYDWFLRELTGILCGVAYINDLDDTHVISFLDLVQPHSLKLIDTRGKTVDISQAIDDSVLAHPLYNMLEYDLINYKPGRVQVGPGEFYLCFYDQYSLFGIDNTAGYDIIAGGKQCELKRLGTNLTTPELFDKYAESGMVDLLVAIKPISGAKRPKLRSQMRSIRVANWRDAFHHANGRTLAFK